MDSRDTAEPWGDAPAGSAVAALSAPVHPAAALVWAGAASTLHRIRRGEGALLAVNLSLIAVQAAAMPQVLAELAVSLLVLGLMYALNDLWDAPTDVNNPKKDPALIGVYLAQRRRGALAIVALKLATLALAAVTLGPRAALAVAAVMTVNVVYSTLLKGVPVIDVAWCGLWGALYAAIVSTDARLVIFVGLMTAVCHLYQTLDDRVSDAANGITTTAVRSRTLSTAVLIVLSAAVVLALRDPFGLWALTGLLPLALYFAARRPLTGWILTKVYFGAAWLALLGLAHAAG